MQWSCAGNQQWCCKCVFYEWFVSDTSAMDNVGWLLPGSDIGYCWIMTEISLEQAGQPWWGQHEKLWRYQYTWVSVCNMLLDHFGVQTTDQDPTLLIVSCQLTCCVYVSSTSFHMFSFLFHSSMETGPLPLCGITDLVRPFYTQNCPGRSIWTLSATLNCHYCHVIWLFCLHKCYDTQLNIIYQSSFYQNIQFVSAYLTRFTCYLCKIYSVSCGNSTITFIVNKLTLLIDNVLVTLYMR